MNITDLTFWDTKFRFCEEKAFRLNKCSKKFTRCDNNKPDNKGYIILDLTNKEGKKRKFKLSRLVFKANNPWWNIDDSSIYNFIDHKDKCKTNNHIDNLRKVTHQQNNFNQSNTKGYHFNKQSNKFQAQITINRKQIHLGYHDNETDAHNAYLKAKQIHHIIPNRK
tara:strand:+ start:518 stop:1015 length:498 start_codon:yes stop_codon:yes gene_type:complete